MPKFLHDLPDFKQLIAAVSNKQGIAPTLIEKDYWIMHCLWGLQAQGYCFELKGGTSLSKGFLPSMGRLSTLSGSCKLGKADVQER